ncbi:MAG: hypothetical protein V8Q45_12690 [Alistipes onderdonkii]
MKLEKVLDKLNSFEKNAFLKVINNIIANKKDTKAIDNILDCGTCKDLKNFDSIQVAGVFQQIEKEYIEYILTEYSKATSQFDLLIDIVSRDGNSIMRQDWFSKLYDDEIKKIQGRLKAFKSEVTAEKPTMVSMERIRDYKIYKSCLHTAYHNDEVLNFDAKITYDEQSILDTLAHQLELSQEEKMMIKYCVLPVAKQNVDTIITDLKDKGIIFYSKKFNTIYVADEIVALLRKVRGKDVADKYFRRTLLQLREPQINLICKKHNIDTKLPVTEKIALIVKSGVSFSSVLNDEIHKADTKLLDRRKVITELCDEKLQIMPQIKGASLEEKVTNLIAYFDAMDRDDKIGISSGGFEKLVLDLNELLPLTNKRLRDTFELQDENVMHSDYLCEYNIKPRDILELLTDEELAAFCTAKNIKQRGNTISNILDSYKDSENLYVENYEHIGFRNLSALKENGIVIKEADLGLKFEEVTRHIFSKLGFEVDEKLRKKINTEKDKIDIIVNLGEKAVLLIECKTSKDSGYNKFSTLSRQIRAYKNLLEKNDFTITKVLIVAPDFSDDFITDCSEDFELNMSLLKASSLVAILSGFKDCKHKQLPVNLLLKDVLIQEDRIIKAINK